ncbi:hypothetical protein RDI58_001129 [Solanum bulbocastanum]|uniref:Uncharacterized protein n=1 Tax=Solanum bulbocastanum TaxID=147425 RepID=A0AAN8UBC2_SOLBU
MKMPCPGTMGL